MNNIATVAELLVKISGDSQGLQKELKEIERQLNRAFGPDAMEASSTAATMLAGLGVAALAAGAAAVKFSMEWASAVNNIEDVTGMSGEAASRLMAVGQMVGLSGEDMGNALVKMSKSAMAAKQSIDEFGSASTDAYTKYGIAIVDANNQMLSGEQIFANVLARHREMANGVEKTAMELEIFGKSGAKLNDLLNLTDAQMSKLTTTADRMGLTIGSQQSQAWEDMGFEVNKARLALTAIANTMVQELLPSFSSAASGLSTFLAQFAVVTKAQGLTTALRNLIPPEVQIGIFALAGALTVLAIPSLLLAAKAAIALTVSLAPVIALGAALGAVAYVIWAAWEPLSQLFVDTWAGIAEWAGQKLDDMVAFGRGAIESFYNLVAPILPYFTGIWDTITGWVGEAWDKIVAFVQAGVDRLLQIISPITNFIGKTWTTVTEKSKSVRDSVSGVGDALARMTTTAGKTGEALGAGSKAAGKAADDLAKKVEQTSKAIEREWVQTTKTQLEQLEIWKAEQIAKLDETKAANENYQRDLERLAAVYSTRRTKILQQEASDALSLQEKVKAGYENMQTAITGFGLKGSGKGYADIENEQKTRIKAVADYYKGIQSEWTGADDAKKARIIANLNEAGVAYRVTEQGNLDFSKAISEQELAISKQTEDKKTEYKQTASDVRAEIDAAYQANSMAMLQAALTEENAIRLNDYEAQQSMMQTYQAAFLAAHATTAQLMAGLYSTAFGSLSTAISDVITGAKAIDEAFAEIGKTLLKVVADFVAKWIAGKIMIALTGKQIMTAEVAAGVVAGKAMAAAWAPAAAAVSLATFGANSAPAMAGIAATYALTTGLSYLASGGLTTGPSLAVIGEGNYDEAVLPLSDRVFAKLAAGINSQGGGAGAVVTQNVYGDINTEADYQRIFRDLGNEINTAMMGA